MIDKPCVQIHEGLLPGVSTEVGDFFGQEVKLSTQILSIAILMIIIYLILGKL